MEAVQKAEAEFGISSRSVNGPVLKKGPNTRGSLSASDASPIARPTKSASDAPPPRSRGAHRARDKFAHRPVRFGQTKYWSLLRPNRRNVTRTTLFGALHNNSDSQTFFSMTRKLSRK